MTNDPVPQLSFTCPQCQKRLKARESMIGKRVECPRCKATVLVPGVTTSQNEADDWLALDGPSSTQASKKDSPSRSETTGPSSRKALPSEALPPAVVSTPAPEPSSPGKPGSSVFDDDLPDLSPLIETPKPPPSPVANAAMADALARLSSDDATLQEYFKPADEEEFSFPCKVCGTLLYASITRVGTMTRCPDCHSEFSIPSRPLKKKVAKIQMDPAAADVRLAPIEGNNPRVPRADSAQTKQILEKAAIEAERERQEIAPVSVAFDSKRWISLIFGFLRDPGLVFIAAILGVFAAVCFYVLHSLGTLEMPAVQIWILRAVLFAVFCIPILIGILLCCVVIVPMAANRKTRVEEWPFGRFGEAIGEVGMGVSAIAIAAFPGGVLATLLASVGVPQIFREALVLISIWGITPILLLSMIDSNRITMPFSKTILKSISTMPDAWGAMYFQTGIAMVGLFILFAMAVITTPTTSAFLGFLLPLGMFFIANQYGLLAGRISEITELGFEGDFTEDEAG